MKNTNKVIGIPGYKKDDAFFGVGATYMAFADTFANVRIIMPWEEKVAVDLLILPGGLDVNPMSYGQIPGYRTFNQDVFKDFFFKERLGNYIGNTKVLGICLGMQMLNVHLGGTLHQDLMFHDQSSERWTTAHKVYEDKDFPTNDKVPTKDTKGLSVNSHHHQCVFETGLAPGLTANYFSYNYDNYLNNGGRIVESFFNRELMTWGVQWHPEELYDGYSVNLIKNLLK